ncbi:MAG: efflux RND transporter periplasmic adaptor subunit [Alphaproteobacteria bacterium]
MRFSVGLAALALLAAVGGAAVFYATRGPEPIGRTGPGEVASGQVLYWRDPDDKPVYAASMARTPDGRDFRAVREGEEPDLADPPKAAKSERRILFYRNPMGLADTSAVPKKDWMGMDYIPVFEGVDEAAAVTIGPERIQRSGVRTEIASRRVLSETIRAAGTAQIDERRVKVVVLRFDGFIEELFANVTGKQVMVGEKLFRVYGAEVQRAQADLLVALREKSTAEGESLSAEGGSAVLRRTQGSVQRLRNLDVPESRIREIIETSGNPRTIDWPSPVSGTIIQKRVLDGQRVAAGEELYRIADLSSFWIIANVSERDLPHVRIGSAATVTLRAYPQERRRGIVTFIYPDLQPDTRTARVRIETPNQDGRIKADMYADVEIGAAAAGAAVVAVPVSAVIDSGNRQIVIVSKGEGRFEPRDVTLGRRGQGYVEVMSGVSAGESVVTSATFLIDAESNLKAALQRFTAQESKP